MKYLVYTKIEDSKEVLVESYESDRGFTTDSITYVVDSTVEVFCDEEIFSYMNTIRELGVSDNNLNAFHKFIVGNEYDTHEFGYESYGRYYTVTVLTI